jgi:hypothetical protein
MIQGRGSKRGQKPADGDPLTQEVIESKSKKLLVAMPRSDTAREACLMDSESWMCPWKELS